MGAVAVGVTMDASGVINICTCILHLTSSIGVLVVNRKHVQ